MYIPMLDVDGADVRVVVRESAVIKGKVVDADGKGISGVAVRCLAKYGNRVLELAPENVSPRYDTEGNFTIGGLPGGTDHEFSISASGMGYGMEWRQSISMAPGQVSALGNISLKVADAFVSGRVVDLDGKPVAGALVDAFGQGQPSRSAASLGDGSFRIDGLVKGVVSVSARVGTFENEARMMRAQTQEVSTGSRDITLVVRPLLERGNP